MTTNLFVCPNNFFIYVECNLFELGILIFFLLKALLKKDHQNL